MTDQQRYSLWTLFFVTVGAGCLGGTLALFVWHFVLRPWLSAKGLLP